MQCLCHLVSFKHYCIISKSSSIKGHMVHEFSFSMNNFPFYFQYIEEHLKNKRHRESLNPCKFSSNPCHWCDWKVCLLLWILQKSCICYIQNHYQEIIETLCFTNNKAKVRYLKLIINRIAKPMKIKMRISEKIKSREKVELKAKSSINTYNIYIPHSFENNSSRKILKFT